MNNLFGDAEKCFPAREVKTPDFSSFVSFDIETTGLARTSNIIEIGAVKVVNGKITECFSKLVNPGISIPSEIINLTGICDRDVENEPDISVVLPEFSNFAGNNILVGHNAVNFDCKIMSHWAEKYGVLIPNDVFDTFKYAKYRCEPFPGLLSNRLSSMCDYFNIEATVYHRAAADAEVTAKLYLELQKNGVPKRK